MRRVQSLMLGRAVLAALVHLPAASAADMPRPANRMRPTQAPTPFHADDLRQTCAEGSWRTFRLSTLGPQGWTATQQTTRFLSGDDTATQIEVTQQDASGRTLGEPQRLRATWEELQRHAAFPLADTRIESVPVTLDCGQFDAWLYLVESFEAGKRREKRLWFARGLAGPPIAMEEWLEEELIFRMMLIDYGPRVGLTPDVKD